MILLPFDRAFDWRNPPVVTLVLVLLNSLCFFIWQGGEEVALDEAIGYYYSSGLAEQEYAGFVRFNGTDSESTDDDGIEAIGNAYHRYFEMRRDSQFYAALIANQVITPDTDGYAEWRSRRDQYEALLVRVVFIKYGLKTAQPDWQSMIAHMFLHADFMHLFGNMFFLIAVGLLVEQRLGRWTYLLSYLVVGWGSGLFDVWISAGSFIPGIGASGAVSGVMGMYSVLYWTRKVRFFYFIFVYFDYVRLPAIALLPLWIGNELYQIGFNSGSNINYLAHLGGYLSGALIALLLRHFSSAYNIKAVDKEVEEIRFQERLGSALGFYEAQNFRRALPMLKSLFAEQPDNRQLLYAYYHASKLHPESEGFHQVCGHVLELTDNDAATERLVLEVYRDYTAWHGQNRD